MRLQNTFRCIQAYMCSQAYGRTWRLWSASPTRPAAVARSNGQQRFQAHGTHSLFPPALKYTRPSSVHTPTSALRRIRALRLQSARHTHSAAMARRMASSASRLTACKGPRPAPTAPPPP
eukprot:scaffold219772_cov17-Tisochrysis_lutea.AAC.2